MRALGSRPAAAGYLHAARSRTNENGAAGANDATRCDATRGPRARRTDTPCAKGCERGSPLITPSRSTREISRTVSTTRCELFHRTLVGRQLTAHHARQATRAASNRDLPFTSASHRRRTNMYEGRPAFSAILLVFLCGTIVHERSGRHNLIDASRGGGAPSPWSTGRTDGRADGRASSVISSSRPRSLNRRRDDRRCIGRVTRCVTCVADRVAVPRWISSPAASFKELTSPPNVHLLSDVVSSPRLRRPARPRRVSAL